MPYLSIEGHVLESFIEQVVADYMTRNVKTVTRGLTLRELGDLFEREDFNTYPVAENGQVVGLVSKFDHLACFVFTPARMMPHYDDLMKRTVGDVMTSDFIYVGMDTRLTRVLQLMVDHRIRSMPVIDSDQLLLGIISREDVMRALQRCTGSRAPLPQSFVSRLWSLIWSTAILSRGNGSAVEVRRLQYRRRRGCGKYSVTPARLRSAAPAISTGRSRIASLCSAGSDRYPTSI